MKIFKVIHGYPMRYNAGSEVYSQMLCQGLADRHQVHVFSRVEDPFAPECSMRTDTDPDDARIALHLINVARSKDRYRHEEIDARFAELLDRLRPDIVHIGHLNHLSTSLVAKAAERGISLVYTLHDYWLMCPRGQFMQMFPQDPTQTWTACDGQQDRTCAERCYARYFSGDPAQWSADCDYWTDWVARRMAHVREMAELIDVFIAPARYLYERYQQHFGISKDKLLYLDYGFALERLQGRIRSQGEPFTFGYIGTHIPAKGIHLLIEAFGKLQGNARLRIWGRPRGQDTEALKSLAASLPIQASRQVEWLPEYRNQEIVADVFNRVDAIVVPSIWVENSPLVIHEALQARVPVITADTGGMSEYVAHEVNGLTFRHRDPDDLALQMQRFVNDPAMAQQFGQRGYVQSDTGDVPSMTQQVREIETIYRDLLYRKKQKASPPTKGPWRITLDTNPQLCNLSCIMCEEHSPFRTEKTRTEPVSMPIALLERTVAQAVPHGLREIIPSTMGEPLLYEHFTEILNICRTHGVKLNLTTNGTFPRLGARAWAERIVPVASDVKISWNGATKSTYESIMLGSRWEKALENVQAFVAVRDAHATRSGHYCRVTLQMTFLETNVAELSDLVRLARDFGVDRLKGHHVWTHYDQTRSLSMRRSPQSIASWNRAVEEVRLAVLEHPLPNGQHLVLDNIFVLREGADVDLAPGGPCPFLGQEAWVSAEGHFAPCCAPDVQRRTLGTFGTLHEHSLMDIWHGRAYQDLMANYHTHELCRSCNMRKPTGGES